MTDEVENSKKYTSICIEQTEDGLLSLRMCEKRVTTLEDHKVTEYLSEIKLPISPEMLRTEFQIRNPSTDNLVPNGTMTYADIYVSWYSLFRHLTDQCNAQQTD